MSTSEHPVAGGEATFTITTVGTLSRVTCSCGWHVYLSPADNIGPAARHVGWDHGAPAARRSEDA